jgi:phosphoglycolate phosphatase-like HAD superfamily hydrolase
MWRASLAMLLVSAIPAAEAAADSPLPSWNDGAAKQAIVAFVQRVTKPGTPDFVPEPQRIAAFDNDGTLWAEQPMYFQLAFTIDRMKALAPQHPDWKTKQPFKAVLEGHLEALAASGEKGIGELIAATHAGMTTDEFATIVTDWAATSRHPRFQRPYTECVYAPMVELLSYLRGNGFKTYIVSGGGVEFMRPWAESVYGIPPEQVIGSSGKLRLEWRGEKPVLVKLPAIDFVNDREGKPVGIQQRIGKRPIFTFGNSDGDHQMLQWTAAGAGARFVGLLRHTDAEREWAYDRQSSIGRLDKALDEAIAKSWTVVDMKRDWKRVFAFE